MSHPIEAPDVLISELRAELEQLRQLKEENVALKRIIRDFHRDTKRFLKDNPVSRG
jgi:hypothetical protein